MPDNGGYEYGYRPLRNAIRAKTQCVGQKRYFSQRMRDIEILINAGSPGCHHRLKRYHNILCPVPLFFFEYSFQIFAFFFHMLLYTCKTLLKTLFGEKPWQPGNASMDFGCENTVVVFRLH